MEEVKKECGAELIDPFMESPEENVHKKKIWDEIFATCPEFANFMIEHYETFGAEQMNELVIMYDPKEGKHRLGALTPAPEKEA